MLRAMVAGLEKILQLIKRFVSRLRVTFYLGLHCHLVAMQNMLEDLGGGGAGREEKSSVPEHVYSGVSPSEL